MVKGWKLLKLSDICEISSRLVDPRLDEYRMLPHIGNANIEKATGKLLAYNKAFEDELISGKYYFSETDVLYGKINPQFAKACFPQFSGLCSADIYPLTSKQDLNPQFLLYILLSEHFTRYTVSVSMRSGMPKVNREELLEYECVIPPLPEQHGIAEALSDTDSFIASLEKLIAKKKAIKQGAMQELLTGKRRLPGFSGEWKVKSLLDLGTIIPGLTYKPENVQPHGLLVLRSSNIHQERLVFDDCVFVDCEINSNQYVKKGDILICVRNGSSELIGKCAFIDKDYRATFGAFMSVFRSQYAKFIFQVFRSDYVQKQIRNNSNATINQITKKDFENIVVPVPPTLTEQSAIADVLSDMDSEIEALIAKLHKVKLLKKGMMQELLTGRIRLVQAEAAAVVTEKPKLQVAATSSAQKVHNRQFDDAVMIAGIVNAFYSARYPLGRKKVQKLLYLLRRKQDESIVAFKKKAAGPYADEVRYKGGEPIANRNRYIATMTIKGKGTTFTPGENIGQALDYIERWGRQSDIHWLAEKFRYTSVDDLELLATVDMAICDLEEAGIPVSVASIKHLIATNKEWQAKLQKKTFADSKIAKAISDLQSLL